MSPNRIDVNISSRFSDVGFRQLKASAAQARAIIKELAAAQAQMGKGGGGNAGAQAAKAQATALKLQAQAARTAAAESSALAASIRATSAQTNAAAAAAKAEADARRKAANEIKNAEQSALGLAQAQARLQSAAGNYAQAERTLADAIAKTSGSSRESLAAQTQLLGVQQKGAQAAARAESSMLSLAQAQAKAHVAAGNMAQAESILSSALTKVDGSSKAAIAAQTQLIGVQNKVAAAAEKTKAPSFASWIGPAKSAITALGGVAIALAGISSAAQAIKGVADYESSMAILQANTGAGADEMERAGQKAKELGADLTLPATSAAGAATAINELVKGGLDLNQAMDAAQGTLQLAAAGAISEADAATYATAAINGFGLAGKDANLVADQFAAGAAATSTSVTGMAQSLEQGGGLFASYQTRVVGGVEALTQFNTAVGVLATAGITGGRSGTYIASAMERLANPTDRAKDLMSDLAKKIGITGDIAYDAQGKMRPFEEIMHNVAAATGDMTNKQRDATIATLFLTEGSKAVVPIIRSMSDELKGSSIGWDAIKEATTKTGAAQAQAAAQMAGLNGAVAGLQSQMETLAQNALEPFLPLMTSIVAGAAQLAGALSEKVGPAAIALATGIKELGMYLQSVAIPAMAAATAATLAYALANTALFANLVKLPGVILAGTVEMVKSAAAMAAAALPYVMIATAIGGMTWAWQDYQAKVSSANKAMLEGKSWWQASTTALDNHAKSQMKDTVATKAAANTVNILRDKIEEETRMLGVRMNAGQVSAKQFQAELAVINQHAAGLQAASDNLQRLTDAQVAEAAAAMNATTALISATGAQAAFTQGQGEMSAATQLTADDLERLNKEMLSIFQEGAQALGAYVQTEIEYYSQMTEGQQAHADKMAELQGELGKAKTAKAREAIQEQIAAEREGYAAQEAEQAASYARQQAAQDAALGQMLIAYIANQVSMGTISAEKGNELAQGITEKFGIIQDMSQTTFLGMAADIDEAAKRGGGSVDNLTTKLLSSRDKAVELQGQMNALQKTYEAEVLTTMKGRPPEEIAAALRAIPARVYAEVIVKENYISSNGGGMSTAGRKEWESNRPRRSGTAMAGGGTLITEGPMTVTVGDNPGGVERVDVTPLSGKGKSTAGHGVAHLAGGGSVAVTGATPTAPPRAPRTRAPRRTQAQISADKQTKDAQKVVDQLQKIQQDGAEKLLEIHEKMTERLAEIDARAAKQQMENRRKLNDDIASDHADMLADMEADDLDFYDKSADPKELKQREAQQAQMRAMMEQAQSEAKEIAKDDAELAKDTLAIREDAAQKRMQLDARYNEVAAQASKKDRAKLKTEYDQAVAAQDAATQTKLDIARQEAEQRKKAQADEKAAVVADSREQAGQVVNDAIDTANQVEGATNRQRAAVVLSLADQQNAVTSWSSAFHTSAAQMISDAKDVAAAINAIPAPPTSSGGSTATPPPAGNHAGGGGDFLTSRPTKITVGDNPGGVERVTVTPISGVGKTRVGGGMAKFGGGGTIWTQRIEQEQRRKNAMATGGSSFDLSEIDPANLDSALSQLAEISRIIDVWARKNKVEPGLAKKFAETVKIVSDAVSGVTAVRDTIGDLGPPVDASKVQGMVTEMVEIVGIFQSQISAKKLNVGLLSAYAEGIGAAIDVLQTMAQYRRDMEDLPPPVDVNIVAALAEESRVITRIVQYELVKLYQEERDALANMGETMESVTSILGSVLDLRNSFKDIGPPILLEAVEGLADEANSLLTLMTSKLIPMSKAQADEIGQYADAEGNVIDVLTGVADLRKSMTELAPPLSVSQLQALADEGNTALGIIIGSLVPDAAAQGAAVETYAKMVGNAIDALTKAADLRGTLRELSAPIDIRTVMQLSAELRKVVTQFFTDAIPTTSDFNTATEQYALMASDSVDALTGITDLAKTVSVIPPPINMDAVRQLSATQRKITALFFTDAIPATADFNQATEAYAQMSGDAVDTISGIAGLGADLKDVQPIDLGAVARLANTNQDVVRIVRGTLLPTTQEEADAFGQYASTSSDVVGLLGDMAGLGKDLAEAAPVKLDVVNRLANDAQSITAIVRNKLLPTTEAQADAVGQYSDAASSSISLLSDTAGLTGDMLADYRSPTDSELSMLVADANRIVGAVQAAAAVYDTAGLDATQKFSDALGSTVGALTDGLTLVQSLQFGEVVSVDMGTLATFEKSMSSIMVVGQRLGAQASTIAPGDLSALGSVSSTLNGVYESLINLAAVPMGDLPSAAAGMGGMNYGMAANGPITNVTIQPGAVVIYAAPGQDASAIGASAIQELKSKVGGRR